MNALEVLKGWAYNEGEFEELVYLLANNGGFKRIQALAPTDLNAIVYRYKLSNKGEQIALDWAKKNGYACIENSGEFEDVNESSVENTLQMLGEPNERNSYYMEWNEVVIDD